MNILAACGGRGLARAQGRLQVLARTTTAAEQDDPAFFTEEMDRPHPPRTPLERDIVEAERAGARVRRSATRDVTVTVLRFANGLGPGAAHRRSAGCFGLPAVPMILGFDPRFQFIHEDDVVGALEHAVRHDLRGRLQRRRRRRARRSARSPACSASRSRRSCRRGAPALAAAPLRRARAAHPARDRSTSCASAAASTTASSRRPASATATRRARPCIKLARAPAPGADPAAAPQEAYRYEREVEEFLRWSPSVRPTARRPEPAPANLAPGERRAAGLGQGSARLRRPRRRGAHRSAALAGARGAGRARRRTSAAHAAPAGGHEGDRALAGLGSAHLDCLHIRGRTAVRTKSFILVAAFLAVLVVVGGRAVRLRPRARRTRSRPGSRSAASPLGGLTPDQARARLEREILAAARAPDRRPPRRQDAGRSDRARRACAPTSARWSTRRWRAAATGNIFARSWRSLSRRADRATTSSPTVQYSDARGHPPHRQGAQVRRAPGRRTRA